MDICGGTGQVSFLKGVSRFLLSTEGCEKGAGKGFQLQGEKRGREITKFEKVKKGEPKKKKL